MILLDLCQFAKFDERSPDLPAGSERIKDLERLIESRCRIGVFTHQVMRDRPRAVNHREIELMLVARREFFCERRVLADRREIVLTRGQVRQKHVQIMLVRPRAPFDGL